MKKLLFTLLALLIATTAFCQPTFDNNNPLGVTSDGSTVYYPWIIYFPGATVSDGATGTTVSITGGSGVPSLPFSSVQFNNSGAFGGSANFTWNNATQTLTVGSGGYSTDQLNLSELTIPHSQYILSIGGNTQINMDRVANTITFGNGTDNPAYNFSGSGLLTANSIRALNTATANVVSVNATGGAYYLPYNNGSSGNVITLQSNGTSLWQKPSATGGSGTPGGADTNVQYNDGGVFGGDANLTWNKGTQVLTETGTANFVNASARQVYFKGWDPISGAGTYNGAIQFGDTDAYAGRISYGASGLTQLVIENTYDNATAKILFRTRTSGTPVNVATMNATGLGIGLEPTVALDIDSNSSVSGILLRGADAALDLMNMYVDASHNAHIIANNGDIYLDSRVYVQSKYYLPTVAPSASGQVITANTDTTTKWTNNLSNINSVTATSMVITTSIPNQTYVGITITGTAGQNLVFGNLCYMDSTARYNLCNADNTASMPTVVLALGTINSGSTGNFLLQGYVRDNSLTLSTGAIVYATTNVVTTTQPSSTNAVIQTVGYATANNTFYYNPSKDVMQHI